ncbi:hypothetical protein KY321_01400 [Candidatus Woesearchaeota archaeon]|nr:hypothetical protein [Candidatus Woesearchaeota archaeon]
MKPEELLQKRVSNLMLDDYPTIPFRVDLIDNLNNSAMGKKVKELHGKWNRGYPDFMICCCRGEFGGLYLELKATEKVPNTEHTRTQAQYHAVLRNNGYKVMFVCGYKEAKKAIKKYMKLKKN